MLDLLFALRSLELTSTFFGIYLGYNISLNEYKIVGYPL